MKKWKIKDDQELSINPPYDYFNLALETIDWLENSVPVLRLSIQFKS